MVAKQDWNFLTNPTSLVSQIFKARYFPKTSFLDAKLTLILVLLGGVFGCRVVLLQRPKVCTKKNYTNQNMSLFFNKDWKQN